MTPAKMNKVESAMRIALAFREAFNKHDIETMLHLFSDDCTIETFHPAPDGLSIHEKDALSQYWQETFASHSKIKLDIEEIFGFGERCIVRWKLNWVDTEEKEIHLRGIDVYKTCNDLICEKYAYGKSGEIVR